MAATHRESCHGTARTLADGLVVAVDEPHNIHEAFLHRGLCPTFPEGVAIGHVHALVPPSGSRITGGVAVGHHHNHRHAATLGYQVVHNLRRAPQVSPRRLVAAESVQQIHHGETPLAVVGSRQIDRHTALLTQRRTVVPYSAQRAVGHVVHLIEMALVVVPLRHDEDVAQGRDVAVHVAVGGVNESLAVHREAIGV